jgi:small subunit ribosomal protein S6
MRRYESVVILNPDMGDDDIRSFTERYTQLVKTGGGEIIKIEDWGLKRLAYLVQRKEKGRYILFDYVGNPALIHEIERQFKISEDVMKFISVKLEHAVDLEAFKTPPKAEESPSEPEAAPQGEETQTAQAATPEQPPAEETAAQETAEETPTPSVAETPAPSVAETPAAGSESSKEGE